MEMPALAGAEGLVQVHLYAESTQKAWKDFVARCPVSLHVLAYPASDFPREVVNGAWRPKGIFPGRTPCADYVIRPVRRVVR